MIDFSTFLTLIVKEEVLIIDLSIETLFSTIISPVAGIELIEESDIPIVEVVEPQAVKAKAATIERVIKVFLNNLSPRFDSYLHYISL
jgi:hypothetical protein